MKVLSGIVYPASLSRREDLNLRPLRPEHSALPDCATPRKQGKIKVVLKFQPKTKKEAGLDSVHPL